MSFDRTVLALSEAIIGEHCPGADPGDPHAVAGFLLAQHRRMPDYLRLPFRGLTLVFDAWSLPLAGRPFHRASAAQRSRQIGAWKRSHLGFRRDLVKFYEGLALFAWYSEHRAKWTTP